MTRVRSTSWTFRERARRSAAETDVSAPADRSRAQPAASRSLGIASRRRWSTWQRSKNRSNRPRAPRPRPVGSRPRTGRARAARWTSAPSAIDPLVEHGQQVVEDRAVGVEKLVEEGEFGLGEHPGGHGRHGPFAEPGQVDRPEDLVGLGEPGQEVFEVTAPGRLEANWRIKRRFRRARRPVEEQVLAGHDRQGRSGRRPRRGRRTGASTRRRLRSGGDGPSRQATATPSCPGRPRPDFSRTSSTYSRASPRGDQDGRSCSTSRSA